MDTPERATPGAYPGFLLPGALRCATGMHALFREGHSIMDGSAGFGGKLLTEVIRAPRPRPVRQLRVPGLGRVMFTRDPGEGRLLAREWFASELVAHHRDGDGKLIHSHDLGSGMVTNIGVLAMANDYAWSAQLNLSTLGLSNNHATGTSATVAAATDFKLNTPSTNGGQNPVTGAQSLLPSGTVPKYQTVATINYTGTENVQEWGLFSSATLSATTGSPFTATSATSGTVASGLTASSATARGHTQNILVPGTTAVWGLVLSNSTTVFTIPAWYNQSNGAAGSTPGGTETYAIRPVMWDHRQFAGIGVNNGDSIQFTYQLQINSGG